MKPSTTLSAATALFLALACGPVTEQQSGGEVSRSWNPARVAEVDDVPVTAIRTEIEALLGAKPRFANDEQWKHARTLYEPYQMSPLWMDDDGIIDKRSSALVDALVTASGEGLAIDGYPLMEIAAVLDTLDGTEKPDAALIARADVLLTTAYAALAEDYLTGQIDPKSVAQSWHIDPLEEKVDSSLARALRQSDLAAAIGHMRPQDFDYEMLRRKLADYRAIVRAGGWPKVPDGKRLKPGDTAPAPRLQAMRTRLRAEGIETGDSAGTTYDRSLAAGIAEFQERHAIGVDSMLGKETLDALNVQAEFRLAQIAANLERYRWLPRTLGDRYILVNVPAFRLQAFETGRKTLEMKVIVGSEFDERATPVFSDRMEFVVFQPYWNVTDNIAQNELFPQFERTGMPADYEVYTDNGVRRLRQKPGPKNSLGLVKFMFPNDFNIYLHDTPNRELFEKDVRAFSHGCIRVEKPEELAQWVLGWDAERVRSAMHGSSNRHVNLPEKIPVYVAYMTAYVRNGELWFGNDLYRRDDQLAHAVWNGAIPSAHAARAVDALRKLTD